METFKQILEPANLTDNVCDFIIYLYRESKGRNLADMSKLKLSKYVAEDTYSLTPDDVANINYATCQNLLCK